MATAAGYPNTSSEDMEVLSVRTPAFTGDLLATGLQDCGLEGQAPGLTGVDLWDVTDPHSPSHLGFFDTGAGGAHEVSLTRQVRGGQERVFALAAVPFSEITSGGTVGDFQLLEVTDPRHPVRTDDWGAGKDGGLPFGIAGSGLPAPFDCTPPPGQQPLCRGHFGAVFDHSASPSTDGTRAYLAYWDAGAIIVDISNPAAIRMVGRTPYPAGSEGDTHSAMPNAAGTVLVTTDEDFSPGELVAAGEPKESGDTWVGHRQPSQPGASERLRHAALAHQLDVGLLLDPQPADPREHAVPELVLRRAADRRHREPEPTSGGRLLPAQANTRPDRRLRQLRPGR